MYLIKLLPFLFVFFLFSCNEKEYYCNKEEEQKRDDFIEKCLDKAIYNNYYDYNYTLNNCIRTSNELFCSEKK